MKEMNKAGSAADVAKRRERERVREEMEMAKLVTQLNPSATVKSTTAKPTAPETKPHDEQPPPPTKKRGFKSAFGKTTTTTEAAVAPVSADVPLKKTALVAKDSTASPKVTVEPPKSQVAQPSNIDFEPTNDFESHSDTDYDPLNPT